MPIITSFLNLFRAKPGENVPASGDVVLAAAEPPPAHVIGLEQVDPEVRGLVERIHAFAWGVGLAPPPFQQLHRTRTQLFNGLSMLTPAECNYLVAAEMYPDHANFRPRGPRECRAAWLAEFKYIARSRNSRELIVRAIEHGALISLTQDIESLLRRRANARRQRGRCVLRHFQDPDDCREKKHIVDANGDPLFLRVVLDQPGDDYELLDVPGGRLSATMRALSGWEVQEGWYEPPSEPHGFAGRRGGGGTGGGKNDEPLSAPRM